MKKSFIGFVFLFLYLMALLNPVLPFIEYGIRYDYFSKVLCINKDEPELKCNGKCQLSKKLKEASPAKTQDKQSNVPTIDIDKFPITIITTSKYSLKTVGYLQVLESYFPDETKCNSFIESVFHPPKVLV